MYSGNIGLYYDLENIIKVIEKFKSGTKAEDGREVAFVFVGAGSVLNKLEDYANEHKMANVIFIPYQDKKELIYSLNSADVHWCINAKGIKGVSCPSKAYGIMAAGKPMLGVLEEGSEIRCIIEDADCGVCINPENYTDIENSISYFLNENIAKLKEQGKNGRVYLEENLSKETSINKYEQEICSL